MTTERRRAQNRAAKAAERKRLETAGYTRVEVWAPRGYAAWFRRIESALATIRPWAQPYERAEAMVAIDRHTAIRLEVMVSVELQERREWFRGLGEADEETTRMHEERMAELALLHGTLERARLYGGVELVDLLGKQTYFEADAMPRYQGEHTKVLDVEGARAKKESDLELLDRRMNERVERYDARSRQ